MTTNQVEIATDPAGLLERIGLGSRAAVFDGGNVRSWGDGSAFLCVTPLATLEVFDAGRTCLTHRGQSKWDLREPFDAWSQFLGEAPGLLPPATDPGAARVVTVLGYALKEPLDRLASRHPESGEPILYAALYDHRLSYDYRSDRWQMFGGTAADREKWTTIASRTPRLLSSADASRLRPTLDHADYIAMVSRALEYIRAGDVYEVNVAQRFESALPPSHGPALFRVLRERFPMPFSAFVDGGAWQAVSSSPECFLDVQDRHVSTFPIKGTSSPAVRQSEPDSRPPLREDPKEMAEHVMVVDLERNDLGRVCETGSIRVRRFADLQSFPLLSHLVSEVDGQLRNDVSLPDLIRATFPGGSITGAPKIRAMQIIDELEAGPRGIYTGAIGWSDLAGTARFNIAIRTAVLTAGGLTYHAGGGIVADSQPEREYTETLLKAEAMAQAIAEIGR